MNSKTVGLAIAGSLLTALNLAAIPASADETEKCYGISLAGKNDCASAGGNSCAGHSTMDYDKQAWKLVPAGTCETTMVTLPDGTSRGGSLKPIES